MYIIPKITVAKLQTPKPYLNGGEFDYKKYIGPRNNNRPIL